MYYIPLQVVMNILQFTLLALNAKKIKSMIFICLGFFPEYTLVYFNFRWHSTREHKNLRIGLDDKLSFEVHLECILKRLHPKWVFITSPYTARKWLVLSNYGDIIYMQANSLLFGKSYILFIILTQGLLVLQQEHIYLTIYMTWHSDITTA